MAEQGGNGAWKCSKCRATKPASDGEDIDDLNVKEQRQQFDAWAADLIASDGEGR